MDFIFDEELLQGYGGDIDKFVHDIENCFRTFKTITGQQDTVLWNYFKELIVEAFGPIEFDDSDIQEERVQKKTSQTSETIGEVGSEKVKKRAKSDETPDKKTTYDSTNSESPPKKKQRGRSKGNNTDQHEIMIEKVERQPGHLSESKIQQQMLDIINNLKVIHAFQIFNEPVRVEDVPDYLEMIENPMDFSTVEKNIKKGKYSPQKFAEYAADMKRIGMNCMTYNLPGSGIYLVAEDYLKAFEVFYQKTFKSKGKIASLETGSVESSTLKIQVKKPKKSLEPNMMSPDSTVRENRVASDKKKASVKHLDGSLSHDETKLKIIKKFFKSISTHPLSGPFHYPVNVNEAPGYTDMIKKPMDLSQIKKNLEYYANSQVDKLVELYSDMILIFDNCQTYNQEGSEIHQTAQLLSDFAKEKFDELFPGVIKIRYPHSLLMEKEIIAEVVTSTPKHSFRREKLKPGSTKGEHIVEQKNWYDTQIEDRELSNLSSNELQDFLDALRSPQGIHSLAIKEKCFQESKKFLKQVLQSYQPQNKEHCYSNELYTCISLGSIRSDPHWHTKDYIYPVGYTCKRNLMLALLPTEKYRNINEDRRNTDPMQYPHIQVTFQTKIIDRDGLPNFQVTVGDDILVDESGNLSTLWSEQFFTSFGQPILRTLGAKFLRCRAILYYICTCEGVEPFLEQIPLFSTKLYLKAIQGPMWLGEVFNRLMSGLYDNEFDFAWDMRLIFQNSMEYNEQTSDLYQTAEYLLDIFNILFCQWIQNVKDYSIFDPACGLWDDWMTLQYFEKLNSGDNENEEVIEHCKVTGLTNTSETSLLFCVSCEDCYHPSVSDGGLQYEDNINGKIQNLWRCKRCQTMKSALESNHYSGLLPEKKYIKNAVKSSVFKPASELGSGWVKATQTKPHIGKFISPLGYEWNTKEEAMSWMPEEKKLHEKLLLERGEEYQLSQTPRKNRKSNKMGKYSTRKKRKQTDLNELETELKTTDLETKEATQPEVNENDTTLLTGKLPYLNYDGSQVIFSGLLENPETFELKLEILDHTTVAPAGYSGLDDPTIHRLIEGLANSSRCNLYQFLNSDTVHQHYCQFVSSVKEKVDNLSGGEKLLKEKVLQERCHWRNLEIQARITKKSDCDDPEFEKNISQLLIPLIPPEWHAHIPPSNHLTSNEIECAVHIWESFHRFAPIIGSHNFGLLDVMKALYPCKASIFPSLSTHLFDEICLLFLTVLFDEIANAVYPKNQKSYQEFLSLNPLNSITWSYLAYNSLLLIASLKCGRKSWTHEEILSSAIQIHDPFNQRHLLTRELFCLLLCNPVFYALQTTPRPPSVGVYYENLYQRLVVLQSTFVEEGENSIYSLIQQLFSIFNESNESTSILQSFYFLIRSYIQIEILSLEKISEDLRLAVNTVQWEENVLSQPIWNNLVVSLPALRRKDSNHFTKFEKVSILQTLVQYCSVNHKLSYENLKRLLSISQPPSLNDQALVDLVLSQLTQLQSVEVTKANRHSLRCYFTGIEAKDNSESEEWVVVPQFIIDKPQLRGDIFNLTQHEEKLIDESCELNHSVGQSESDEIIHDESDTIPTVTLPETTDDLPKLRLRKRSRLNEEEPMTLKLRVKPKVCLKQNLIQVVMARELALREFESIEDDRSYLKTVYLNSNLDYITRNEILSRTLSLGFDRSGREYWILNEQNRSLLGGFSSAHSQYVEDEPVLLVRESDKNSWSYICTSSIHELLDYLSGKYPSELFLYNKVAKTIESVRVKIANSLQLKLRQDPWLVGFRGLDIWQSGIEAMINNPSNPLDTPRCVKLQELATVRCLESRIGIYYALINKVFESSNTDDHGSNQQDSKRKLSRVKILENDYDLHSLGWLRLDSYERIRELSAHTIGTKLLCDPTMYEFYTVNMKKSPYRLENPYLDDITSNTRAYIKPVTSSSVNTRLTANILQTRNSTAGPNDPSGISADESESEEESDNIPKVYPSKSIEALHVETGQVLRRWFTGTKAGEDLGVSRKGISLCCQGSRNDAYGFRWRFCEGNLPSINEVPIKRLIKMKNCFQKSTGTYVGLDDTDDEEVQEKKVTRRSVAQPHQKVIANPNRQVPDVVGSLVTVSYRLLKLKIELLNLLAILPKGLLSWPRLVESNPTIESIPSADAESESEAKSKPSSETPQDDSMSIQNFIKQIQMCSSPLELLKLLLVLKKAIPRIALFNFPLIPAHDYCNSLSASDVSCAMVATYLYSLDRWIRYEDIPLDFNFEGVDYRPRLVYTPRCAFSPVCSKCFHHPGKCDFTLSLGDSRFREILPRGMLMPGSHPSQGGSVSYQKSLPPTGMLQTLHQNQQHRNRLPETQFILQAMSSVPYHMIPQPEVPPIDLIQPYIPKKEEIRSTEWI